MRGIENSFPGIKHVRARKQQKMVINRLPLMKKPTQATQLFKHLFVVVHTSLLEVFSHHAYGAHGLKDKSQIDVRRG